MTEPSASASSPASGSAVPRAAVLLVLAGPAGSGKTTLCDRMVAEVPGFSRVVTTTTRAPRPGEIDGVHYHFLTPEQFDAKVAAGEFLEWAWVHGINRYGTLASSVIEPLARGQNLIMNVDVQGVANMRRAAAGNALLRDHLVTVFVAPAAFEELKNRLSGRNETPEEIARRLRTAEAELREAETFDHRIVSSSREEDFQALLAIWRRAAARS